MKNQVPKQNLLRAPEPPRTEEQGCQLNAVAPQKPVHLGRTLITARAKAGLHPQQVLGALYRHAQVEELASRHELQGTAIRIVTAPDRSETVVCLPFETDFSTAGSVEAWVCSFSCPSCG